MSIVHCSIKESHETGKEQASNFFIYLVKHIIYSTVYWERMKAKVVFIQFCFNLLPARGKVQYAGEKSQISNFCLKLFWEQQRLIAGHHHKDWHLYIYARNIQR